MKSVLWQSAMRVTKFVLEHLQTSKNEAIAERQSDHWTDGVVQNTLNNFSIIGKDVDASLIDFFHVKVDTGVGYKGGERITVTSSSIPWNFCNITHTSDDGLGNQVSTPHSTGSFDIPLTPGFINYIWIAYLLTTDETEYTLHKLTNAKQYFKRTDGYEIQITENFGSPDPGRFIFLGQINLLGGNQAISANISTVNRDIHRSTLRRIGIETSNVGKTDRPTTYGIGQQSLFLDDHIKAVGSGVITPVNPHGISLTDLGLTGNQTVEAHRQIEHANGIIAGTNLSPAPTGSALYCQRIQVNPGDDYISVYPLVSGEYALVNGEAFDYTLFSGTQTVAFSGFASGTYYIYLDQTGVLAKTTSNIIGDRTKLPLCSVFWDLSSQNLANPSDFRTFGAINTLAKWFTVGRPTTPTEGMMGYNLSLKRYEYWDGMIWRTI